MSGKRILGVVASSVVCFCLMGSSVFAADYEISFQARGGVSSLSVMVNGKSIYPMDKSRTGPLWHETARFSVPDPKAVSIAFRLQGGGRAAHVGNIRVKTAAGGEVRLVGNWTAASSRPEYITQLWDGGDIPYRMGMALRPPAQVPVRAEDWCEYRFTGVLEEAPNLAVTRIFEYIGCFDDLNYYDDYKNISFSPARPADGQKVVISAKVGNSGSGAVIQAVVALLVDGKEVDRRTLDIPGASEKTVDFSWQASQGAHAVVVRADPENRVAETQERDNMLLRMLFVGDAKRAHPFLLFREDEIREIKARAQKHPETGATYLDWLVNRTPSVTQNEGQNAGGAYMGGVSYALSGDARKRPDVVAVLKEAGKRATGRNFESSPNEMGQFAAYYAVGYDCVARDLSETDDGEIRDRIAKLLADGFQHTVTRTYGGDKALAGYPRPMPRQQYSQGAYLKLAGLSVAALCLADYEGPQGNGERYLHFFLNAFHHEALHSMTSAHGLYREGTGYMGMAENRTGNLFYNVFAHVGYNLFDAWPQARRTHLLYVKTRMPNGWIPPENDNAVMSMGVRQCTYPHLLRDPEERSAMMWAWRNLPYGNRGGDFWKWLGGAEIPMYLIHQDRNEEEIPVHEPRWSPTQFLGDCLIFRGDWSKDSPYLYLGSKHWPSSSVSHDQTDQCQFMFYAKRAFLAIDPGYGQPFHRPVKAWCRGSKLAHNLLLVDGERPRTRGGVPTSVYTYGDAYFPENAFTTSVFDFGESHLARWEFRAKAGRAVIDHRRSVLFPRGTDYFILADDANPLTGGTHEYNFVLHGSARNPYTGQKTPGDFVANPAQAKPQDNLTLTEEGQASVAEWRVNNTEGNEVRFRAVFASPAPADLTMSADDGWCGYVMYWAARQRYLEAKTSGARTRYLVVLFPDYVDDPADDAEIRRLEGQALTGGGTNAAAARIAHTNGDLVDYVQTQDPNPEAPLSADGGKLVSDAEISFCRLSKGKPTVLFMARGSETKSGTAFVRVNKGDANGRVQTALVDLTAADRLECRLDVAGSAELSVGCPFAPKAAQFLASGADAKDAESLRFRSQEGHVSFSIPGAGKIVLSR